MFSISTLPEINHPALIAKEYDIKIETSSLIFIGQYDDMVLDKIRNNEIFEYINSAHGPFFDLIPATSDQELKELIINRFTKAIKWCEKLGINSLILHSGWFPKTYTDKIWLDNSIKFWSQLLYNTNTKINIYIENVYEDNPYLLRELVSTINLPNFGICLDIGHVNANSSLNIKEWLVQVNTMVKHLHIHNNYGINDEHNGLISGTIKFPEVFELFHKYCPNAFWNLEIKTEIIKSIDIVKESIVKLF